MPPIPDEREAAFARLIAEARTLFPPAEVAATRIGGGGIDLPHLAVPGISFLGEQWIVVGFDADGGRRLELDWDDRGLERAVALLRARRRRMDLDAAAPGDLPGWVEAIVGSTGRVSAHAPVAEFDVEVRVQPQHDTALPFRVHVRHDGVVVVEGEQLGWWTFGGEPEGDGTPAAKDLIEQIVLHGGSIRRTWRGLTLLDDGGDWFAGPIPGARLPLRPQRIRFAGYR